MKNIITAILLLFVGTIVAQNNFTCGDLITDADGNDYETLVVGSNCWTKSNIKTTTYNDGNVVAKAMIYNSSLNQDTNANLATFGRLYTWFSAVNVPENSNIKPTVNGKGFVQGICPDGWHIPTTADINALNTNSMQSLRSTEYWLQPNDNTNSTGFGLLPAGYYTKEIERFEGLFGQTFLWTDSITTPEFAVASKNQYFCYTSQEESRHPGDAVSVRCVKDYCVFGEGMPCPGIPTVTDHEGNVYNTITMGSQCWTKENMRCKTSPKGYLTIADTLSSTAAHYYVIPPSGTPKLDTLRGMLYNWAGALDTIFESQEDVSFTNRRGICPEGWHVPSDEEWGTLTTFLSSQPCYYLSNDDSRIAKAISSKHYWQAASGTDIVGKELEKNNITGFSIVPAGYLTKDPQNPTYENQNRNADLWSSTSSTLLGAYYYTVFSGGSKVYRNSTFTKRDGRSVRCLKNS